LAAYLVVIATAAIVILTHPKRTNSAVTVVRGAPALAAAVAPRHRLTTTLNVVLVCAFVMRKVAEYEDHALPGRPLRSGSGVADGIPGRPWRSGSGAADGIPGRPWRSRSGAADGSINPPAKFFSDEQPRRIASARLICTRCHADVKSVLRCPACGALCPTSKIGSGMLSSKAFAFYVLALVVAAIFWLT